MRLEVLVSTMHQTDYSLLDRMNIQTDAIVINQCDTNSFCEFEYKGHVVKWFCLNERGVGLSRNTALMRSSADICLFADDDVVYGDGYEETVLSAFEEKPKVDLIVFNLQSLNPDRPEAITSKTHRLRWYNCLKYGAFRIAIRREQIIKKNVVFSLLFGGGAEFQAGEDNLFITNCIQVGLKCYSLNRHIGTVKQEKSTWFNGYDDKYYRDRGALFYAMYGKKASTILVLFELKKGLKGIKARLHNSKVGVKNFKKRS